MGKAEWNLLSFGVLGWLSQLVLWGPKTVPTWFAYSALGLLAFGLYVIGNGWHVADQQWWMGFVAYAVSARGAAGALKDVKLAPKTDSL